MYIYEREEWPHFKWDNNVVNNKLMSVNKSVGYLYGRLSSIGFDAQMSAVMEAVSHDVIATSEIEGVSLNSEQVRSSVARKLGVSMPNYVSSSHYVDGIVEMTLDAIINYSLELSHDRLFGWHNCLFPTGWSEHTKIDVAQYRTGEMKVVSGMMGREKIHYIAPHASSLKEEMNRFLEWYNHNENNDYTKSAIAHLWFVCIHPFDDGNGRIGRAIADMALSQIEDSKMRFFSMSYQINKEKKQYYDILERTQKGDLDITEWILWYLDCMLRSVQQADSVLSRVLNKSMFWQNHSMVNISDRQRLVLNIYLDGYPAKITVKNWAKHADVSHDTASRDIKDLVEKKILIPQPGKVRDVSYGVSCSETVVFLPDIL